MVDVLEKLTEFFMKFPGIGPRQARRFAFFLAGADEDFVKKLSETILETRKKTLQCQSCFRFWVPQAIIVSEEALCPICSGLNRDKNCMMVVEKDMDFETIEKTGVYGGKYFILGGTVSLQNDKEKDKAVRLRQLFEKVKINKPKEIILALSATVEGDNTARYIARILDPLLAPLGAKITYLGRGLSTGVELEYIDKETFNSAMENRK